MLPVIPELTRERRAGPWCLHLSSELMEAQKAQLCSVANPDRSVGSVSSDIVCWLALVNRPHFGTAPEEGVPSFAKFVQ